MKNLYKLTFVLLIAAGISSCSDFLEPSTPQNFPVETIEDVGDLNSLIIGALDRLSGGTSDGSGLYGRNYIADAEVRSDNAFSTGASNRFVTKAQYNYTPLSGAAEDIWSDAYDVIANTNLVINAEIGESPEIDQVKGQAYALRALAHMMILEYYGQQWVDGSDLGIPYVTTFADPESFFPSRTTVQETFDMIGADFQQAVELMDPELDAGYSTMTYYGARALQARYALYVEDYALASAAAEDVINNGGYTLVDASSLITAWATDGEPTVIFGMDYTTSDNPGINGLVYIYRGANAGSGYGDIEATPELYNIYGDSDVRRDLMVVLEEDAPTTYRMAFKFPDVAGNNNHPVIRYAEVLLIYAEAQLRLGNAGTALTTLNMIPANRNASGYASATIDNILLERRKELAFEGRRFFALLRNGRDITRTSLTGGFEIYNITVPFGDFRLAYPISNDELDANSNIQQNAGYD